MKSFLERWNFWRSFYFQLGPMYPKTKGQLTSIENAIQFAQEKDMDMNMLVACTHRAFIKRSFKPNFTELQARGEEYYERFYDEVVADIDKADYEERAER